jgi:hypothetical protein
LSKYEPPKDAWDFVEALAMVKANCPAPIWMKALAALSQWADVEVIRVVRYPPAQVTNNVILPNLQGRAAIAYDLSAIFDTCTQLGVQIRELRETKERANAERSATAAGQPFNPAAAARR